RSRIVPSVWGVILARNLPIYRRLPAEDQLELLGHVQVFLDEKKFEGCGGLKLTDEIRLTIAGQACLLLLHRETDYYPQLSSILVYPTEYIADEERHIGGGIWEEGGEHRLGHTGYRLARTGLGWGRGTSATP